jgi:hypothetical protein
LFLAGLFLRLGAWSTRSKAGAMRTTIVKRYVIHLFPLTLIVEIGLKESSYHFFPSVLDQRRGLDPRGVSPVRRGNLSITLVLII